MSAGARLRQSSSGSPPNSKKSNGKASGKQAKKSGSSLSFRRTFLHFVTALLVAAGLLVVEIEALCVLACTVCALMWLGESQKGRGGFADTVGHFVARHCGGREHEFHSVNGVTWYVTGLVVTSFIGLARGPGPCLVGVLTLGFGDPSASWIGKRYGSVRFPNGKSVEGSAAFVLVSFAVSALAALAFPHPYMGVRNIALGSVAGALGEVFCPTEASLVNDNMIIPVFASAAAALV